MRPVLLVDDDDDTRSIYQTMLRHYGYDAVVAADGPEGVRLAQAHEPSIIVMNLSMPTLDGISAISMLREDPRTASIPIIACTGFVREDGEDLAEDAGCDAYLEKPCQPSRLVQEIQRFIGPPVAPAGGADRAEVV
jgi:two-component system, cell cycle response regulator DivK